MKLYDYNCKACGHNEIDVMVKSENDEVRCKMCDEIMERQFSSMVTLKTTPKHHRSLEGYKPGRANVNFGRLKDL